MISYILYRAGREYAKSLGGGASVVKNEEKYRCKGKKGKRSKVIKKQGKILQNASFWVKKSKEFRGDNWIVKAWGDRGDA